MKTTPLKSEESGLKSQLRTLMFLRVMLVSLFLGAGIVFQIKGKETYFGYLDISHFSLIAVIYLLTLVYALGLRVIKNQAAFAYVQVLGDTILITWIIHVTGGEESLFSLLYVLAIISGSIMLYRKGGLITATVSTLLYGVLLYFHLGGDPSSSMTGAMDYPIGSTAIFYNYFVNVLGFYLVALLASYLSEKERRSSMALKATKSDLVNLELLNQSIIKSINAGLIALDDSGSVILFNPAAERIFGIRSEEALGKQIKDVIPLSGTTLDHAHVGRQHGLLTPNQLYLDINITRTDGIPLQVRYSLSPLKLSDRNGGSLLVFQDITEMKKIEEEMKKVEGLALVGELAAGVAHEIRNPLASISGSIEMLKEMNGNKEFSSRLMDIIIAEVERLNQLVNDFLLFARPKRANYVEIDLSELISETLELFKNSPYWSHKIELKTHLATPLPIHSDPEQLKQVIWNLLLNACQEIDGGGTLEVSTRIEEAMDNSVPNALIQIRDSGNGFPEENLPKIFTPFFTTKEDGSGLGLAIAKRIVDGLGGSITAENHPQGGAMITILLPYHPHQ